MNKEEFNSPEVCKLIGIKRTLLQQWTNLGYIWPSLAKSSRPGQKNLYSTNDLCQIMLFKRLLDIGLIRETAADFSRNLNWGRVTVVKGSKSCLVAKRKFDDEGQVKNKKRRVALALLHGPQQDVQHTSEPKVDLANADYALVVDLSAIKREVYALIEG